MKYVKQFLIILIVTFTGEILRFFLPFPIPASIYGMVLMFICLMAGIIKLDAVRDTAKFLVEIMPVMFIPAGVGLMTSWGILRPILFPICLITVVTLITVMAATGRVSQWIIRRDARKYGRNSDKEPGTKSDKEPGTKSDMESGTKSDKEPGMKSDKESGTKSDMESGTKSDMESGILSEINLAKHLIEVCEREADYE